MTETPRRRSDSPAIREAQRSAARTGSEATGNDESGSMEQSPGHDEVATTPNLDLDKTRRRRRFWLIYSLAAVVALVLAATTTVPGPQRLLTLGTVIIAIVGLVAVVPWVRRSPPVGDGEERKFSWGSAMAGPAMLITGDILRSVGPDDGGFATLPATVAGSALLILPMLVVVDEALRRRRVRKLSEPTQR